MILMLLMSHYNATTSILKMFRGVGTVSLCPVISDIAEGKLSSRRGRGIRCSLAWTVDCRHVREIQGVVSAAATDIYLGLFSWRI